VAFDGALPAESPGFDPLLDRFMNTAAATKMRPISKISPMMSRSTVPFGIPGGIQPDVEEDESPKGAERYAHDEEGIRRRRALANAEYEGGT
jgi:hypothetical protein